MSGGSMTALKKAQLVAYAALEKKGINPVMLDLRGLSDVADFFVIVSGQTPMHTRAIYREIDRAARESGLKGLHVEGETAGTWILYDMGDVVVHVFRMVERRFYNIERVWSKGKIVPLPDL